MVAEIKEASQVTEATESFEAEPSEVVVAALAAEGSKPSVEEVIPQAAKEETGSEPEAEKPLSWHRRLVRFSEKPVAEGETQQAEAVVPEAAPPTSSEHASQAASHNGERPVEFIFRESAEPLAVFAPKTPAQKRPTTTEEVSDETAWLSDGAVTEAPDLEHSDEPKVSAEEAVPQEDDIDENEGSDALALAQEPEPPAAAEAEGFSAEEAVGSEDETLPEAASLSEPTEDVPEVLPNESHGRVEHEVHSDKARRTELPQEPPMARISRPRMMPPITMEAIPSLITSLSMGKHRQESAEILPPAKPPLSEKPAPPVLNVAEGAARYRPGLARALRYAALDDGPPARASEGLTAMRRGSREVEKIMREEKAAASPSQPVAMDDTSAGMSRRWGMLSRFGRAQASSESSDEVLAATGTKGRSPESGS